MNALAGQTRRRLPLPGWLADYQAAWLKPDVIAGLTVAAVVIPKAMAYATIAGLPVQVGLYTAFLPMLVYVAARHVARVERQHHHHARDPGRGRPRRRPSREAIPAALMRASATLTLIVGAMLVAAWVLRLGFVANFISEPVLIGFKAGIGVVIVLDQIPKLLGFHIPRGTFLRNIVSTVEHLPQTSVVTLAVAVAMIAILVGFEHFLPRVPAPLVAVAAGIAGTGLLGLKARGVEVIGHIPKGFPSLTLPDFSLADALWSGAIGIALMSFTETVAAGRAFAGSDEPPVRANRELLATGLGNAAGALLGAMPSGGGTSQTAVNRLAGARTQLAEVVTAAGTLATMFLLAPLLGLMPQATLAAVVVVYSVGLIKPAEFRSILRVRRTEFIWALAAFAGVMLFGTLKGILVAIILSLIALAYQVANPPVHVLGRKPGTNVFRPRSKEHPEDESFPGCLFLRLEGRIFFANAERIGDKIRALIAEAKPKVVVLDMGAVFDLEYTALKMLIEAEKRSREQGLEIWLVRLNPEVLAVVQRSTLGETLGRERMLFNLEMAVARLQQIEAARARG